MAVRGVRGATVVSEDTAEIIHKATRELILAIIDQNPGMQSGDIASIWFTVTEDLTSAFPARAARQVGWDHVPLMCAREIPVPGSLQRCIRILMHWNTDIPQSDVRHVYLGAAASLRPDISMADV